MGSLAFILQILANNNGSRKEFPIYKIEEGSDTASEIRFQYPGGIAYNAETLAVSPKDGSMYVIRKSTGNENTLYRFPETVEGTVELIEVCNFDDIGTEQITGGDIHHLGEKFLIRTYENIYEYHAKDLQDGTVCGNRIRELAHNEPQGEAVAYLNKSHSFYSLSERTDQPLYLFTCDK